MPSRGRLLRRVAAIFFLAFGVLLLILLATPWPADLLRREIVRRAGGMLGGRIEIASLEIHFFPPRALARGILYEGTSPGGDEIRLACGEAEISAPYRVYGGRLDRIDSLRLVRPELSLRRGGGVAKAPVPGKKGPGRNPPFLGRLEVEDASVRIEDPAARWEVAVEGVNLAATGGKNGGLEGSLAESRFLLRKGDHRADLRGAAAFRIEGKRITVPSFRLNSGADPFHAAGSYSLDLSGPFPQFHLSAEASLAGGEAPRELIGDLAGRVRLDLRGENRPGGLRLSGSVKAQELGFRGWKADSLSTGVLYEPGKLELSGLEAGMLGGALSGQGSLRWSPGAAAGSRLEAKAHLAGASVEEVSRVLRLPPLPLAGKLDHSGEYRMEGFDLATLEARGTVGLQGHLRFGGQEAVTGTARFRIAASSLEVEEAILSTATAAAKFQGKIGLGGEKDVHGILQAAGSDLGLIEPWIGRLPQVAAAPLSEILRDSSGADLAFDGRLDRRGSEVVLSGTADARSLELRGSRLGDLHAGFSVSSSRVEVTEASLSGGETSLEVSGWIAPHPEPRAAGGSFALKGKAAGADLAWLMDWTGIRLPAEGKAAASFDLSGGAGNLLGRVDWRVEQASVASLPLEDAGGRLTLVPGGILLEETRLARGGGVLEASGSVGFGGGPILVYVNGEGIRLDWLQEAGLLETETTGQVHVQAQLTGTLESPSLEMDLETPGVTVKGIDLGAISIRANADRHGADFQVCPEEKGIAMAGKVDWSEGLPFQADLELERFELNSSSLAGGPGGVDAGAVLTGSLHASGALRDPSRLDVMGDLGAIDLRLGQEHLNARSPAHFRWRPPRLELTPFHLAGGGADVTLSGHLEPEGGGYQFTAEGETPLAVLAPFWPGLTAGGTGTFSLSLKSSAAGPSLEGWIGILQGRLQGGGLPLAVSSLEGHLVLDPPGGFHLENVSMVAGGGKVTLEGMGKVKGLQLAGLDLALTGRDVLLLAPEGFRGRYDLDLKVTQEGGERLVSGKIGLIRGVYDRDFRLEKNLLSLGREEPAIAGEEESSEGAAFLQTVKLDLDLEADRGIWLINDFATLEGSASFHVGGTAGSPQLTGRFSALEGGTIRFRQVRYRLDRGNIDLVDPERFNPYLDLYAETTVSDYQVNLRIEGNLDDFTYELTSSPPLTQPEIVALLVSGRSPDTALETGRVAQDMAAGYLTEGLTSGLGGVIQGMTGLDQFSIDPVYLTRQGDPASRVTVGKQITENLFAAYSTLLGSSSEEMYQLEYRVSRDVRFSSVREEDGSVGGDLRYILRLSTAPKEGAAPPEKPPKVAEIRVEGDPGIPEEKLARLLRLKAGEELDRARLAARVEKVLKKYHRKDHWQAAVETREEPVEGEPGRVRVRVKANAGPVVKIRLEGVPSGRKRKGEIENLWSRSVFPEETPEEARAKLEERLREEGYYHAKVELTLKTDTPALREVIFAAHPGVRVKVQEVEISGNETVGTEELRPLLKTGTGRGKYLRPEQALADAGRIRAHYIGLGYAQVKVSPPDIEISGDGALATVRFQVVEGEPTTVAEIRIEGNQALPSEDLLKGFPVRPGEPYTREKARSGAEAIRRAYDLQGYSRAKVSSEIRGGQGPLLLYHVEEGPRRLVGKIEIEGTRLTRREVVERELTFKEGKPLSLQGIMESQKNLYRLGIFSAVEIRQVEGEDPSRPTVRVEVAETRNLTQSLGLGYATDEGIRGLYDVTNSNLLGRGRTVGLQLRASQVNNRIQFVLRDPYLFNRRLDSLMTAFRERQEKDGYTLTERGTTLQVSNKHGEKNRTYYRYTLKEDKVTDLKITLEEAGVESLRLSGLSSGYVHDSRDNFYNPRSGIFASVDLSAYGQAIGSEAAFVKFFARGSLFRKLLRDTVWAQALRIGLANPFGISDTVPISERFFAGGDTTVRGFQYDQLGPKDPVSGDPVGGESLIILNEELRFPIWRFLRGVVFLDAGNVTAKLSDFNPLDLRTVLGTGLHIDTPIGPIRFEYGWKLDREEGESPGELHITIGQAF